MLIESLARLVTINEECKSSNIVLHSADFMKDTQEIIDAQVASLSKDLEFSEKEPGPYVFGIGTFSITIFTPVHTASADWVMILNDEKEEVKKGVYVFTSIYGMIESLITTFEIIQNTNSDNQK